MSGYDKWKRNVLRHCLNFASDGAEVICGGRLLQKLAPETGKAHLPTVERLISGTASWRNLTGVSAAWSMMTDMLVHCRSQLGKSLRQSWTGESGKVFGNVTHWRITWTGQRVTTSKHILAVKTRQPPTSRNSLWCREIKEGEADQWRRGSLLLAAIHFDVQRSRKVRQINEGEAISY